MVCQDQLTVLSLQSFMDFGIESQCHCASLAIKTLGNGIVLLLQVIFEVAKGAKAHGELEELPTGVSQFSWQATPAV